MLAELSTLPSDLTVREWVAHRGLDPCARNIRKLGEEGITHQSRRNRHLRRALYMTALVPSRCDPHAKAFFESLLARKKARLQALIAVARKLLRSNSMCNSLPWPGLGRMVFCNVPHTDETLRKYEGCYLNAFEDVMQRATKSQPINITLAASAATECQGVSGRTRL